MPLVAPLTATPTSSQLSTLLSSELHRLSNLQSNTPPPLSYELTAQDSPLLPQLIDHTLLAPTATIEEVHRICNEATTHGFKAVCVSSLHVGEVAKCAFVVRTVVLFAAEEQFANPRCME